MLYDYAKAVMSPGAEARDAQEGICTFREQRDPVGPGNSPVNGGLSLPWAANPKRDL